MRAPERRARQQLLVHYLVLIARFFLPMRRRFLLTIAPAAELRRSMGLVLVPMLAAQMANDTSSGACERSGPISHHSITKTALPPYAGKAPWSYKDAGSFPVTSASANSQAPTTPVPSRPPTGPMSNGRASAPHRLNSPDGYLSHATQQDVKRRQPHL